MTEISGEWRALSYNQYRADIRSQSASEASTPKVGPYAAPLFFYALFVAFLAKSPSSPVGSAHYS